MRAPSGMCVGTGQIREGSGGRAGSKQQSSRLCREEDWSDTRGGCGVYLVARLPKKWALPK